MGLAENTATHGSDSSADGMGTQRYALDGRAPEGSVLEACLPADGLLEGAAS